MGVNNPGQVDRYMAEGRYSWWPPRSAVIPQSRPPNYPYSGGYGNYNKYNAHLVDRIFKKALDSAKLGKHKKAIKYYKKIIKINYYSPGTWNNIGSSYYAVKKLEVAITSFDVASGLYKDLYNANLKNSDLLVQIKNNWIDTLVNLGILHTKLKNYPKVISAYQRILSLNPDMIDVRYELGIIHEHLGNHGKAFKCFEKLVETLYKSEKPLDSKSKTLIEQLIKKGVNIEKIKNKILDEWY